MSVSVGVWLAGRTDMGTIVRRGVKVRGLSTPPTHTEMAQTASLQNVELSKGSRLGKSGQLVEAPKPSLLQVMQKRGVPESSAGSRGRMRCRAGL